MKKNIFILAFLFAVNCASGQVKFSINPFAGYTFSETFYMESYTGEINDSWHYGGALEIGIRPAYSVEILYQRQSTSVFMDGYYYDNGIYEDFKIDAAANYIMLGGIHYISIPNEHVKPFAGLSVGAAIFENNTYDGSATRFAVGMKLGLKIQATPAIGFIAQAQLLSTISGAGGDIWFAPSGMSYGVSTYSSIMQFGLTGGISLNLSEIGRK